MNYPTIEDIVANKNNQIQLGIWYRFLSGASNKEEVVKTHLIDLYFKGFTPTLSKQIGWDKPNG